MTVAMIKARTVTRPLPFTGADSRTSPHTSTAATQSSAATSPGADDRHRCEALRGEVRVHEGDLRPDRGEWEALIANNPFPIFKEGKHVHVVVLNVTPTKETLESLRKHAVVEFKAPQLRARLDAVLSVIYLQFSQGCHTTHAETPIRRDLCDEARRLAKMLAENPIGDVPAVHALLALMCFHAARFDARVALDGGIVLFEDQDRSAWNWGDAREGMAWLARSAAGNELTRYHVEAGIAWEHCRAPTGSVSQTGTSCSTASPRRRSTRSTGPSPRPTCTARRPRSTAWPRSSWNASRLATPAGTRSSANSTSASADTPPSNSPGVSRCD